MIKKLTDSIIKITNLRTIITGAAAFIVIEIAFGSLLPAFVEATGGTILDMSIAYTADFAYERLAAIEKAADIYFRIRLIDFVFPAVYAVSLSVLSAFVYRKKYEDPDNYRWILLVPLLAAVFDYIENILLVILYRSLPAVLNAAASVLNVVTILKFGLLAFGILLIITGAFSLLKGGDSMLQYGNKFKGEKKNKEKKPTD